MHERGGNWGPYCRRLECKLFIGSRYKRHNYTWESWHTSIRTRWKKKGGEAYKRERACWRKTDKNRHQKEWAYTFKKICLDGKTRNQKDNLYEQTFPHMFIAHQLNPTKPNVQHFTVKRQSSTLVCVSACCKHSQNCPPVHCHRVINGCVASAVWCVCMCCTGMQDQYISRMIKFIHRQLASGPSLCFHLWNIFSHHKILCAVCSESIIWFCVITAATRL